MHVICVNMCSYVLKSGIIKKNHGNHKLFYIIISKMRNRFSHQLIRYLDLNLKSNPKCLIVILKHFDIKQTITIKSRHITFLMTYKI